MGCSFGQIRERSLFSEPHRYNAMIFMDECHATGFFGKTGKGTEEYFGLEGKVDIINSTLGKALGGAAGGYTSARSEIVQLLRQRSRPYLFSNSLPPAVVAAASKVNTGKKTNIRRGDDSKKQSKLEYFIPFFF